VAPAAKKTDISDYGKFGGAGRNKTLYGKFLLDTASCKLNARASSASIRRSPSISLVWKWREGSLR